MGRQTRAKYRRWRRAEEAARRSRQAWRVASLCLIVLAAFAIWVFYDRVYSQPPVKEPPPPLPRPVTLYQPEVVAPPPAPAQEKASSGEERPAIPKTRAKSRRVAIPRWWEHEQANVSTSEVSREPVPQPAAETVLAPPMPPAPPAPVRASASRSMPKKPAVVRVTQEKQKKKKKKRKIRQRPVEPKPPAVIVVPPARPGPPNTSTLHEVDATPIDD